MNVEMQNSPSLPVPERPESPPLAELVERLSNDLKQLTREEAALAKHEVGETLQQAKTQLGVFALGSGALAAGALVLLTAAVLGLATVMPAWSAALAVGLVVSSIGLVFLLTSKSRLSKVQLKPEKTLRNLEKDVKVIKKAAT